MICGIVKNMRSTKLYTATQILMVCIAVFLFYLGLTLTPKQLALTLTANPSFPSSWNTGLLILDAVMIIIGISILAIAFHKNTMKKQYKNFFALITMSIIMLILFEIIACMLFALTPTSPILNGKIMLEENKETLYTPHHYLNYVTTKNFSHGENQHNSLGFRGEEIEEKNGYRIVAIGGSTTYGSGVKSYKNTYPYLLEKELEKTDRDIEVINAGVGGYSSWESLINLQTRVVGLKPDLIIIYHAVNDVHSRIVNPSEYMSDNSGARKQLSKPELHPIFRSKFIRLIMPITSFGDIYGYIFPDEKKIAGVTSDEFNPKIGISPSKAIKENKPSFFENNIRSMIGIANAHNISVLLTSFQYYEEGAGGTAFYHEAVDEHNAVIKDIANELRIPYCDIKTSLEPTSDFFVDSVHLNEKGNLLKAQIIQQCIEEQILENGKK